jgi:hypothetical protein
MIATDKRRNTQEQKSPLSAISAPIDGPENKMQKRQAVMWALIASLL